MAEPEVTGESLDAQIEEMFGGMDKVGGQEPPEPEARVEAPKPAAPKAEPEVVAAPPEPSSEDRFKAALSTIESLQREVSELRAQPRGDAARPEPSIAFEEVLGRRIPKDRSGRPIKVTADDLLKLGWNEDPAKVIEDLGNAFLGYVLDVIPQVTTQGWQQQTAAERMQQENHATFWGAHEDLKGMEPFVATVEQMSRQDGSLIAERDFTAQKFGTPQAAQKAYGEALGRRVREKVAAMRGLTLDQYLASSTKGAASARPASRAVSSSGAASQVRSPSPAAGTQQAEMDDLINNR